MTTDGNRANPPPVGRRLTLALLPAVAVGTIGLAAARLIGLEHLSGTAAPQSADGPATAVAAPETGTAFRADTVDIMLKPRGMLDENEREYKVAMKKGDVLVYSWTVLDSVPAKALYYDFHSQSDPEPQVRIVSHAQATGTHQSGALTAPFDGTHGWYFQNRSGKPVTIRLRLAGFYRTLSPAELAAEDDDATTSAPPPAKPKSR